MADRQTVSGAYAKIESHEELCAERYANIHGSIADIKSWVKWGVGAVFTLAVSLIGFLIHELYSGQQDRLTKLEGKVSVDRPLIPPPPFTYVSPPKRHYVNPDKA